MMTHLGRMVSHQSTSSCLRVCLCGDCCCRVWWWLQSPVLLHHPPRTMPSHGVVRPRDYTSTRQLVHDNAAPPFFTESCCYCSASRAATEYTSIASPSRKPPSPPAALAPFNVLDEDVHSARSLHLAHAACLLLEFCGWSIRPLDLLHERPSDLHRISWRSRLRRDSCAQCPRKCRRMSLMVQPLHFQLHLNAMDRHARTRVLLSCSRCPVQDASASSIS